MQPISGLPSAVASLLGGARAPESGQARRQKNARANRHRQNVQWLIAAARNTEIERMVKKARPFSGPAEPRNEPSQADEVTMAQLTASFTSA
jgi:hypothetical protein